LEIDLFVFGLTVVLLLLLLMAAALTRYACVVHYVSLCASGGNGGPASHLNPHQLPGQLQQHDPGSD